ncbi:TetR/AcrR family transcriptional regulator [Nocardioides immobilis]|uniref:TetR/AcrR family transcriptional regulator n=2 Tax=Nocardioides immobilis TaxID=2049295 RepID=A0A417Y798_9ACTN|nr:TetR/AcrR family transcriptional regulator [Nocardioides immobilis]
MIEAALRLFAERPFESVSTADLARAAGTTRTNLNYHFGNKRNLYLAAIDRFATVPLGLSRELAIQSGTVDSSGFHSIFDRWLTLVEQHRETFKVLSHARRESNDQEVVELLDAALSTWEDYLLRLTRQPAGDRAARARIRSFQAMIGAATDEWLEHGVLTKNEVCDLLVRTLQAMIPE